MLVDTEVFLFHALTSSATIRKCVRARIELTAKIIDYIASWHTQTIRRIATFGRVRNKCWIVSNMNHAIETHYSWCIFKWSPWSYG